MPMTESSNKIKSQAQGKFPNKVIGDVPLAPSAKNISKCFATAGDGSIVVGSLDGKTRLYSSSSIRQAKTSFAGLGAPITHVDITYDEKWNMGSIAPEDEEVTVEAIGECLSMVKSNNSFKREWKICNFSKLGEDWLSEVFTVGDYKWKLWLYPKGSFNDKGYNI
ncbi:Protein CYPRO4 [Capsicum chinense]|nr:Protein CYPRO4 [Capsicum chinense]